MKQFNMINGLIRAAAVMLAAAVVGLQPAAVSAQNITVTDSTVVKTDSLRVTLNATGSIAPAQNLALTFQLSAPVTEIFVTEGQHVKAGTVLAKISSVDAEAALRNAQIALAQVQAAYDNLTRPPREVDLAVAEAQVTSAKASIYAASQTAPNANAKEIARLQTELAKNQLWQSQINRDIQLAPNPEFRNGNGGAQASEIGANSQVDSQQYNVDIQTTAYQDTLTQGADAGSLASGNAALIQAEANLDNLKNPATADELRRAEIDLESARLGVQKAQQQLTKTELVAPIDGLIANSNLTVGEMPPAVNAIILIDDSHYTIDLPIDETDIVNVAVGQPVTLSVVALKGISLAGQITKIDTSPKIQGQLVTYTATATLDTTDAPLRPQMSATATITTGEIKDVVLVPNRFIRVDPSTQRTYVTIDQAGKYTDTLVTIGVRNETNTQIVSGLQAGDTIVLLSGQTQSSTQGGLFRPPAGGGGANAGGG